MKNNWPTKNIEIIGQEIKIINMLV